MRKAISLVIASALLLGGVYMVFFSFWKRQ